MTGRRWSGEDRVSNAPVRKAFLSSHLSASDVCRAVGWFRICSAKTQQGDTTKLKRVLGLQPSCDRRRDGTVAYSYYKTITIANATAICRALGMEFDALYDELPASRALGGVCACGERMVRPAERCGFCEAEFAYGLPRVA